MVPFSYGSSAYFCAQDSGQPGPFLFPFPLLTNLPFSSLMLLLASLEVVLLMPPAQDLLFMFLTSLPTSLRHHLNPS